MDHRRFSANMYVYQSPIDTSMGGVAFKHCSFNLEMVLMQVWEGRREGPAQC